MSTESVANRRYKVSRPVTPDGYGIPESNAGLLPWSFVDERMATARNYWIGTTRPDGRPHAMPVWGVWLEGILYIEGSPKTRRNRNLAHNPAVVVHLESGDQVVIVEGTAREVGKPEAQLALRLSKAYSTKYDWANYHPQPDAWDGGGLHAILPEVVFAWSHFPEDTTRWELLA